MINWENFYDSNIPLWVDIDELYNDTFEDELQDWYNRETKLIWKNN